jgi:shikimate dehydrogenase
MSPASATRLFALLGQPVAGNPTQEMVEAALESAGVEARYVSFEVEAASLSEAVAGVRALGFEGFHVTVPHKVAVVPLLDRLTPAAEASGAVNCVKRDGTVLVGENTDGKGFLASLRDLIDPAGIFAVVIGAGGAARAVATELALAGAARILVVNRSLDRAQEVAAAVVGATARICSAEMLTGPWPVPPEADVVVQATSVGMGDAEARLPLRWSALRGSAVAADVVIAPPETAFLRDARAHGYRTLSGLGMLVEQAAIGFRWWTGLTADRGAMQAALERELGLA